MNLNKLRILKLTNGDLIIGDSESIDENNVSVTKPYTIIDFGKGPCVVPYELHLLMEPMNQVTLRMFDIMWSKALSDFPMVEQQYISATTGIETDVKENIILT
jgi:hypothetical protein